MSDKIILYDYWRSTAAYRVRIALNIKKIDYQSVPIHLVKNGGEQFQADYLAINPQARVPSLMMDNLVLTQSLAILEYLEEKFPEPSILPTSSENRAHARAIAQLIACDIHPINNLSVLNYLKQELSLDQEQVNQWYQHWVAKGFTAIEQLLQKRDHRSSFCYGDYPTIADIYLVGQVYNANRFACDLSPYSMIEAINERCLQLPTFDQARPENQADAVL